MPASIISRATMDRVVDAVREGCNIFDGVHTSTDRQLTKIGERLYAMNFAAVHMRNGAVVAPPSYKFATPPYPPGDITRAAHQYQAVRYLLSQCSEQDMPETPLYRHALAVQNQLANYIAGNHPAVSAAPLCWPDSEAANA